MLKVKDLTLLSPPPQKKKNEKKVMAIFSPQPWKKLFFWGFFPHSDPPGRVKM